MKIMHCPNHVSILTSSPDRRRSGDEIKRKFS